MVAKLANCQISGILRLGWRLRLASSPTSVHRMWDTWGSYIIIYPQPYSIYLRETVGSVKSFRTFTSGALGIAHAVKRPCSAPG